MIITEIKTCARNKNRVNVYIDEEFAFALYLDTALSCGLKKGKEIIEEDIEEFRKEDEKKYALEVAIRKISYKMCTQKEVEKKLKEKELSQSAADFAIEKLKEYKYLDDEQYAQMYAEELSQKYGSKVIVQKLILKGIDREMAQKYTSISNEDVLKQHIERYEKKYQELEQRKRDYKIVNALMNKGFKYDDIKSAMRIDDEY